MKKLKDIKSIEYYENKNRDIQNFSSSIINFFKNKELKKEGNNELFEIFNYNNDYIINQLNKFKKNEYESINESSQNNIELSISLIDNIKEKTYNKFFNNNIKVEDKIEIIDSVECVYSHININIYEMNRITLKNKSNKPLRIYKTLDQIKVFNEHLKNFTIINNFDYDDNSKKLLKKEQLLNISNKLDNKLKKPKKNKIT
jgi:hypothetical protein